MKYILNWNDVESNEIAVRMVQWMRFRFTFIHVYRARTFLRIFCALCRTFHISWLSCLIQATKTINITRQTIIGLASMQVLYTHLKMFECLFIYLNFLSVDLGTRCMCVCVCCVCVSAGKFYCIKLWHSCAVCLLFWCCFSVGAIENGEIPFILWLVYDLHNLYEMPLHTSTHNISCDTFRSRLWLLLL